MQFEPVKLWACRILIGVSWIYLAVVLAWLAAYLATGDRYGYLALVNIFAVYLFYPLPLVLAAALICRSPTLGVGFVVAAVAFGGL